jgi:PTS system galactitol-specific IIC component
VTNPLQQAVQWVLGLGAAAFLPVIILGVGVAFGMRPASALRSGLYIGIGFQGLNLVLGVLTGTMGPITRAMAAASGIKLDVLDAGWEMSSAAAWATPYAALVIPLGVVLNILLLRAKFTKTLNVDIWNYWHFLYASSLAYVITGNFLWGLFIALLYSAICLKVADWLSPIWQNYWDLQGTSCTTLGNTANIGAMSAFFGKIIDMIPGVNKVVITPAGIQEKFGVLGEPMFLGAIVGGGIAIIGRQKPDVVIKTAVAVSAVMVLMPRMVQLLMEGLRPIALAAQEKMKVSLKGQDVRIGMDVALGLGDPTVISTTLLMIPVKLLLAFILPGNRFFPLAGLASPYLPVFPSAFGKGNIWRSMIICTFITAITMYFGTWFAAESTAVIRWAGVKIPEGQLVAGAQGLHQAAVILVSRVLAPIFGK